MADYTADIASLSGRQVVSRGVGASRERIGAVPLIFTSAIANFAVERIFLSCGPGLFFHRQHVVPFVAWSICPDFAWPSFPPASVTERIHKLRQLSQVWRTGSAEVS